MPDPDVPRRFEALARHLEVLASETRLELLHALRTPRLVGDIRVMPSLIREGENADRAITRQAVARHLEQLQEAGLVHRDTGHGRARGDTYVLNHERLFALVDELRSLAKLRPILADPVPGRTIERADLALPKLPLGPRLLVAYGRDDGVAFALEGPPGARWRIGRAPACEVRLDYDPYLSSENSAIERTAQGFEVRDGSSRNGTWVNWSRLPRGGTAPLRPGDLLGVGRSLLVFQS